MSQLRWQRGARWAQTELLQSGFSNATVDVSRELPQHSDCNLGASRSHSAVDLRGVAHAPNKLAQRDAPPSDQPWSCRLRAKLTTRGCPFQAGAAEAPVARTSCRRLSSPGCISLLLHAKPSTLTSAPSVSPSRVVTASGVSFAAAVKPEGAAIPNNEPRDVQRPQPVPVRLRATTLSASSPATPQFTRHRFGAFVESSLRRGGVVARVG